MLSGLSDVEAMPYSRGPSYNGVRCRVEEALLVEEQKILGY